MILKPPGRNVGAALLAAREAGDAGAEIRYSTVLGVGLVNARMFEQALPYFDEALKIAEGNPDAGYPFLTQQARLQALIGLKRTDAAEHLADGILQEARKRDRRQQEAVVLNAMAQAARARGDDQTAVSLLEQSAKTSEAGGLLRGAAEAQSLLAEIYRDRGDLDQAERFAMLAAESTRASGDTWAVPERLQTLARLHVSHGKYEEADRVYSQAGALIDSMVGNVSAVLDKTALIKASSEIYAEHFALVAERFHDPEKAHFIVEQVRGRVTADLLRAGSTAPEEAKKTQRAISRLQLKLMDAKSTQEVQRIREEIFEGRASPMDCPGDQHTESRLALSDRTRTCSGHPQRFGGHP